MLLLGGKLQAQTSYNLSFANGLNENGKFCLDVEMSFDAAARLGTSNLVFSFNESAVTNPSIETSLLSSPPVYDLPILPPSILSSMLRLLGKILIPIPPSYFGFALIL